MIAPDSQSVMLVLGSVMAGTRPLGLTLTYGSFFISAKSTYSDSYSIFSSFRMMTTFLSCLSVTVNYLGVAVGCHLPWIWTRGMGVQLDWLYRRRCHDAGSFQYRVKIDEKAKMKYLRTPFKPALLMDSESA